MTSDSSGVESILRKLERAIINNEKSKFENYQTALSKKIEILSEMDDFYTLPIKHIMNIVEKANISIVEDCNELLTQIIQKTTNSHPNYSCLLLNALQCQDLDLDLEECINILSLFKNSSLLCKLNEIYSYNKRLPVDDKGDKIKKLDNELKRLKKILEENNLKYFHPIHRKPDNIKQNIFQACYKGDLPSLQYFIEVENVSKNEKNTDGLSPIHYAALQSNLEILQYLIQFQGVDKELATSDGYTALHYAVKNGQLNNVKYLVETLKANVYCRTNSKETPIHFAASENHLDIVKYFIEEQHVDKEVKNAYNHTPFYYACPKGNIKIMKYLFEEQHVDADFEDTM